MKSPLTDTYHRYGWSQAYGDLGLKSPFFIVRIIGDVAQLCQYEEPPFFGLTHPHLPNSTTCPSCTAMVLKKWCAISRALSGSCTRIEGGATRGLRIRVLVWLRLFERTGVRLWVQAGMVAAARIDWMEVGRLSVRSFGVRLGIQRGKIVDSGCYLSVGSVGWQGSAKEKAREFRHRGPCLYWCQLWCQ